MARTKYYVMFLWLLMQCPVSWRHPCLYKFLLHFSWAWKSLPSWCFFYRENRFVFQASKNVYVTLSLSVCYEQTEVQPYYSGILMLYYIDHDSVAALQMKGLRWLEILFEETVTLWRFMFCNICQRRSAKHCLAFFFSSSMFFLWPVNLKSSSVLWFIFLNCSFTVLYLPKSVYLLNVFYYY